jgi:hypothetical protein
MLLRPVLLYFVIVLMFAVAFSIACGSGGDKAASTPAEPSLPHDADAIRGANIVQAPDVQAALRQVGSGSIDAASILFADVTGDRREDAVVPISSGGSLGNIAYVVLTLKSGTPTLALTRTLDRGTAGGLRMAVDDGKLVETAAEYGPQDPLCCPSVLRKTYFRWDGSKLQVEREEKQAVGGQKKE